MSQRIQTDIELLRRRIATLEAQGAVLLSDTDVSTAGWVLDEDDFASDSDTQVPTQQSVKAYTDALVAAEQPDRVFCYCVGGVIAEASPTTTYIGTYGLPHTRFDPTTNEQYNVPFTNFPRHWTTFDSYLWVVTVDTSASNDVYFSVQIREFEVGDNVSTSGDIARTNIVNGAQAITGGTTGIVQRITGSTGVTVADYSNGLTVACFGRAANQASDNFAGDIGMVAMELVRAS